MTVSAPTRSEDRVAPRGSITRGGRSEGLRPDIQGLRALAVGSVLVFHLWPDRVTGGFVGVDVFFVISGFLITLHLWRSAEAGRLSLVRFYAKRVRRLAPASLTVLAITLVAVWAFVPFPRWGQFAGETIASLFLVENWYLVRSSVDYLAADNPASPVQHFWTLSVEEQFYLVWPLLIIAAIWVAGRASTPKRRLILGVLLVVGGASLVYSVWLVHASPQAAYFDTFGRIWQFCAGAVLAVLSTAGRLRASDSLIPTAIAWSGATMLVATFLLLDTPETPYPGAAALLPVIGTVLVIAAPGNRRGSFTRLAAWRPIQWIGAISFGIYLWHWPLIVLLPFITGHPLTTLEKLGIAFAAIVLAWASTRFIEDPIRFAPGLNRYTTRVLAGALVLALLIAAPATTMIRQSTALAEQARVATLERVLGGDPCAGALSLEHSRECTPLEGKLTAGSAAAAAGDKSMPFTTDCIDPLGPTRGIMCESGSADAPTTVLLWGDSHAASWEPAFDVAGRMDDFHVTSAVRQGCPAGIGAPTATVGRVISAAEQEDCRSRNAEVLRYAIDEPDVTTVVVASYSRNYVFDSGGATASLAPALEQLLDAGKRVIMMRDVPMTGADASHRIDVPDCLVANIDDVAVCNNIRAAAVEPPQLADEIAGVEGLTGVEFVDPAPEMCDASTCYAALGGIPAFADASHLSASFARTLSPWISDVLAAGDGQAGR